MVLNSFEDSNQNVLVLFVGVHALFSSCNHHNFIAFSVHMILCVSKWLEVWFNTIVNCHVSDKFIDSITEALKITCAVHCQVGSCVKAASSISPHTIDKIFISITFG